MEKNDLLLTSFIKYSKLLAQVNKSWKVTGRSSTYHTKMIMSY